MAWGISVRFSAVESLEVPNAVEHRLKLFHALGADPSSLLHQAIDALVIERGELFEISLACVFTAESKKYPIGTPNRSPRAASSRADGLSRRPDRRCERWTPDTITPRSASACAAASFE